MKLLIVMGTRPEAIKLCPMVLACRENGIEVEVCSTAQHREMLDQVLELFGVKPEYDLGLMQPGQSLIGLASRALERLEPVFTQSAPDYVVVQGDTTTALCAALAGYYARTPVIHIEAGLRSGNLYSPFPEEGNRALISRITAMHFAPTNKAADNLRQAGITANVHVVGNTVIDALFFALKGISPLQEAELRQSFSAVDFDQRIILVTTHRRESFGRPMAEICEALLDIVRRLPDVRIVLPVHPNPKVKATVHSLLGREERVHLIEPQGYLPFIWLMSRASLILTDSGGVQEEAPSLKIPVLVMRDVTEREEGIEAGVAELVGTDRARIVSRAVELLSDPEKYQAMATGYNPYGDGSACSKIVEIIKAGK